MTKSKMANRYSPEVRARAVRMVFEHQGSYETQAGAIAAIAPKIVPSPDFLLSCRRGHTQNGEAAKGRQRFATLPAKVTGSISGFRRPPDPALRPKGGPSLRYRGWAPDRHARYRPEDSGPTGDSRTPPDRGIL